MLKRNYTWYFNEELTIYISKGLRALSLSFKIMKMINEKAKNVFRELVEKDLIYNNIFRKIDSSK